MKLKKNQKFLSGFSLMEVIIVIAIIGIMTTVGLVSLSDSRVKKQLETEGRKVVAVIKEAQNNALTGKNMATGSTNYPCKFEVLFTNDSPSYQMKYHYKTSADKNCSTPGDVSSETFDYTLGYGINFRSSILPVSFTVPFGRNAANTLVKLQASDGERSMLFCVCQSGAILDNLGEGDIELSDSRPCDMPCQS